MDHVFVYAEAEKRRAIQEHLFAEPLFPVQPPFQWRDLDDQVQVGPASVSHFPLQHPGGVVGYRIDLPGRSLAYVTDTTAHVDAAYLSPIRNVDVLIHECHFPDGWEEQADLTGHSCASQVARVAGRCGAGRLVLVHLNPLEAETGGLDIKAIRRVFPQTILGADHQELDV
jgi:ribonuclease Z